MRRLPVRYRAEALADLADVFARVLRASESTSTARGYVGRIKTRCERIGDVPFGGRPRDDLKPGLRSVPFEGRAVILYRVERDRVRITNIFYGGRDYEALFQNEPPEA